MTWGALPHFKTVSFMSSIKVKPYPANMRPQPNVSLLLGQCHSQWYNNKPTFLKKPHLFKAMTIRHFFLKHKNLNRICQKAKVRYGGNGSREGRPTETEPDHVTLTVITQS